MTLLELLRQELPKRGGWPEGVRAIEQALDGMLFEPYECHKPYLFNDYRFNLSNDWTNELITREQYEATGWDGTGLPPVGCECERSWCGDKWLPCKILFISDETVVVKLATREAAYGWREVSFRPLRTEAECAIDEMVQLSGVSTGAAKILYDAGYRKG